mmetsp:Transcript_48858/g.77855  ORF Transcript_48858/g.77855 Transcript_48858/m.77855 type:complete len:641 (+) Transcript_48858:1-1923(+)
MTVQVSSKCSSPRRALWSCLADDPEVAEFAMRSTEGVWCRYFQESTNQWVQALYSLVCGAEFFIVLVGEQYVKEVVCPVASIQSVRSLETDVPEDIPDNIRDLLHPSYSDRFVMITYEHGENSGQLTRFCLLEESALARSNFVRSMDAVVSCAKQSATEKETLYHATSKAVSQQETNAEAHQDVKLKSLSVEVEMVRQKSLSDCSNRSKEATANAIEEEHTRRQIEAHALAVTLLAEKVQDVTRNVLAFEEAAVVNATKSKTTDEVDDEPKTATREEESAFRSLEFFPVFAQETLGTMELGEEHVVEEVHLQSTAQDNSRALDGEDTAWHVEEPRMNTLVGEEATEARLETMEEDSDGRNAEGIALIAIEAEEAPVGTCAQLRAEKSEETRKAEWQEARVKSSQESTASDQDRRGIEAIALVSTEVEEAQWISEQNYLHANRVARFRIQEHANLLAEEAHRIRAEGALRLSYASNEEEELQIKLETTLADAAAAAARAAAATTAMFEEEVCLRICDRRENSRLLSRLNPSDDHEASQLPPSILQKEAELQMVLQESPDQEEDVEDYPTRPKPKWKASMLRTCNFKNDRREKFEELISGRWWNECKVTGTNPLWLLIFAIHVALVLSWLILAKKYGCIPFQ